MVIVFKSLFLYCDNVFQGWKGTSFSETQLGLSSCLWCLELHCISSGSRLHLGHRARKQEQLCAICISTGPGVRYPAVRGSLGERHCSWEPSIQGACSPSGGQMCGASCVYLQTSWDALSSLFAIAYLHGYGLRARWIKNNCICEQEGSKKLVRSGAEERTIKDFVFV